MDKHIILIGFMGSGKSTVAKQLAEVLNLGVIDSDQYIETDEQMTISEIFDLQGEEHFRNRELDFINRLPHFEPSVVSVGGGLPCAEGNMEALKKAGTVFYLNVSVMMLIKRLGQEKGHRPLVASLDEKQLSNFVFDKLIERTAYYRKAHHIIPNETGSPETAVKDILKILQK